MLKKNVTYLFHMYKWSHPLSSSALFRGREGCHLMMWKVYGQNHNFCLGSKLKPNLLPNIIDFYILFVDQAFQNKKTYWLQYRYSISIVHYVEGGRGLTNGDVRNFTLKICFENFSAQTKFDDFNWDSFFVCF